MLLALLLALSLKAQAASFDARSYGAAGNGVAMDTAALQKAIDAAAAAGGGTVELGPGSYLSGSLDMKSGVTLQLDEGATLRGSLNRFDYRKLNFYGLLLADKQENISVRGKGVIDGQGTELACKVACLWAEGKLPDLNEGERPVLINFRDCKKVSVEGVTLLDSACWVQEYRDCDQLSLENITVRSLAAPNNDGFDIDGCSHVLMSHCDIDAEDDAICLKSADKACQDVLIENCRLRSSCNALKFGTASVGGFKHITCRNLDIYDTYISGIALEIVDGGEMADVDISHVSIRGSNNAIFVRLGHRNASGPVGSLHGVRISDVSAEIANLAPAAMDKFPWPWKAQIRPSLIPCSISGLPGHPVQDLVLKNISIRYAGSKDAASMDASTVPENPAQYPEASMFGALPAWGFYLRHAEGIHFQGLTLSTQIKDPRPPVFFDDEKGVKMEGLAVKNPAI